MALELQMTLSRINLERFTAFEDLDFRPSPGINVLVGANSTGKTHLMKVAYAACDITRTQQLLGEKLVSSFLPSKRALGRLVKRRSQSSTATVEIHRGPRSLRLSFSNHSKDWKNDKVRHIGHEKWVEHPLESVYIPVKEMLANGPGFRSLYARREIHFESIYADILDKAYLPVLRGPHDTARKRLLQILQKAIDGKVVAEQEEFFLQNPQGKLEFTLLAEGLRKLGLLWLLIQNGTLARGSTLFWDEPETNINPSLFPIIVDILLQLQRVGVQIFIATHDYSILKEFEVSARSSDTISYWALYRSNSTKEVQIESAPLPFHLEHSPISLAMKSLYDREIARSLGGLS